MAKSLAKTKPHTLAFGERGADGLVIAGNLLNYGKKLVKEAVLAKPFPGTMSQGVTQALRRVINELFMGICKLSAQANRIETVGVRFKVASKIATVKTEEESGAR